MLLELIKAHIKERGPITIAEYMALALSHPEHGYYMRKDPLGMQGDFITAPEISQIFGELTGLWLVQQWLLMGKPQIALVELGPGRGTLMADILRAGKTIPGFHDALSVHLIETSPVLKQKQWQALAGQHPNISWHDNIEQLPQDKPWLLIANEFFDALPIRQFVYEDGWKERMVDIEGDTLKFVIPAKAGISLSVPKIPTSEIPAFAGMTVEVNEPAETITRHIANHIHNQGGAALIIDYGYSGGTRGDTLQALKAHQYHDILQDPGQADLTAHVDFDALKYAALAEHAAAYGPVPQGIFLDALGATARATRLCENASMEQKSYIVSGVERLLSRDQMGDLFKVLCLTPPSHPKPEGF